MSTVSCAAIQVTDSITGFPSAWQEASGAIFLDMPGDFDFSLTKNVEELSEVNDINIGGVLGFSIPKSPKNQFILRDWLDPNTFDFQATPVNVIAYSGGNVLSQNYLYVRYSRWLDQTIECALVNDASHWAIGASRMRLNEIEYDDFTFTENAVLQNMQNNESYTEGDIGIYYQLAHYGNPYEPRIVNVEYMRPWHHVLGVLQKGFKQLGWRFECEWLESEVGRRIIAYLLDPEFFKEDTQRKTFLANISEFQIQQIYTQDTIDQPRAEILNYDLELDDPGDSYDGGRYFGFGEFIVEASITLYSFYQVTHRVALEICIFDQFSSEDPQVVFRKELRYIPNDNSTQREIYVKTETAITILPNQFIAVRYFGTSNGRSSWTDTIVGGNLKITPINVFPIVGDMINPGKMLRKDFFIDFIKGVIHMMRGKIHTQYDCKTVKFMPNYKVADYYGDELEGFYFDGVTIDVDPTQIQDSENVRPPDFSRPRYLLLGWKASNDPYVRQLEESLTYPLFSRLVDLGEEFKDEVQEYLNPYFEPTANDWYTRFSRVTNGVPMDLPVVLDHTPDDEKVQISVNIGPRILITKGWQEVQYETQEGLLQSSEWYYGNSLVSLWRSEYPWGYQLPLGKVGGVLNEEKLVYGEFDDDLYNKFWKRWAFETIKNFIVDLLVYIHPRDYHNWDFRHVYQLLVGGKRVFGSLLEVGQFNACLGTATQAIFNANAATVGQFPEEPEEEDPCDTYNYKLNIEESMGSYSISVDTDSPGPITIEWRYIDESSWTVGTTVNTPNRIFIVRVKDGACNDAVVLVQPVDPCGNNQPALLYEYRYDDDTMEHCVIVTIGGELEDEIGLTTFTVSVDSAPPVSYTIGDEVCGAEVDFCFEGEVQMLNNCPPIPLDGCFEVPPVIVNCEDNVPTVLVTDVGLDAYQLALDGSWVSPEATWFFQYKDVGADDDTAQIWDTKSPLIKSAFEVRVVMFWCDLCPKVCSPWQQIPTPGAMVQPMMLQASENMAKWDFSGLSENDWKNVERMVRNKDKKNLMKLHNDRKLSGERYCCGRDGDMVLNWFEYGLRLFRRS